MIENSLKIRVDTQKIVLSSESCLYKTENFLKKTRYISNVDFFVSKLAEGLIRNFGEILLNENAKNEDFVNCFSVGTEDKEFSFLVKFGFQIAGLNRKDIIFFDYETSKKEIRQNDQRLNDYLKLHTFVNIEIKKTKYLVKKEDFEKLYLVSNSSGVNLPKLTKEQKDIVETMDQNVLVQGVAGSGKTNVCIDKIIFSSCRNYGGKVLYSTYSRGLLMDTKLKVDAFKKDLVDFENAVKKNNVIFVDDNHKKALENKYGIFFFSDDDEKIFDKIHKIIDFLQNKVDYLLIEDIYRNKISSDKLFADEKYFVKNFVKNGNNHQITKAFKKIERYSYEVIYKEIFGMIFGNFDLKNKSEMLSEDEYILRRTDSFSKDDCKVIYQIAREYGGFLKKQGLIDLNIASRELIEKREAYEEYSLAILDEVQDFSQVSLCLFRVLSLKLFCVGDALQMINPSFFSFSYLKNLLYLKDETSVKQLRANFRNTKKIEDVINSLAEINKNQFGTHNFVVEGKSVDSGLKTTTVCVFDDDFAKRIAGSGFDNFTFVVCSSDKKREMQNTLKNQEVLTVSEIKGLERNTVVAYNLLTDNFERWQTLESNRVNHKQADENSVYRYYYNLFYVGLTRAKQNLFVVENKKIPMFEKFFKENFDRKDTTGAIKLLSDIVSKVEFTESEILERVQEFIKLGQFENAVWTANKIKDDVVRLRELSRIDISEKYIFQGRHRDAGVKFWELNMLNDAKKQFIISGDEALSQLLDACRGKDEGRLNIDIVNYYDDVKENEVAKEFILQTIENDRESLRQQMKEIKENFKKVGDKNGK